MIARNPSAALILVAALTIGCNQNGRSAPPSPARSTDPSVGTPPAASSASIAPGSDSDMIRQAVQDHVRNDHGVNMSAMDMTVDEVNVNGDQAQANATFRVKQGGTSMAMTYALERHGGGWLVTHSQPSNGEFVHPPMDKTHSPASGSPPSPGTPDVTDFLKNHPAPKTN